ncbi:uncharacterized protein TNCV_3903151 [Trichonephila clavipes]|nr:uncharacterized protein TNCV_3903151 [Trichonephila clavipes]
MGYGSHRPTRVPLLNARHQTSCLAWARKHIDMSVEDWNQIAWSDESRFRLLNVDGSLTIGRKAQGFCMPGWNCTMPWWLNYGLEFWGALYGIFDACANLPQCNSVRRVAG